MQVEIKNLGKCVQGHVLDITRKHFDRSLKNYDRLLYTKWNWRKNGGNGCWEVRRRPEKPYALYEGQYQGVKLFTVEYIETDAINHVLDVPFLNYAALERVKEMDAWVVDNYLDTIEYAAEKQRSHLEQQNRDELRYQIKHHRKAFSILQEEMQGGRNPLKFLSGTYDK